MIDSSVFERTKKRSEEFFRLSHHDRFHIERVCNLAVRIAKEENADLNVIKAAALLHDIARAKEDEGKIADHATEGAKMARKILLLVVLIVTVCAMIGCQTVKGVGEDIKWTGEKGAEVIGQEE